MRPVYPLHVLRGRAHEARAGVLLQQCEHTAGNHHSNENAGEQARRHAHVLETTRATDPAKKYPILVFISTVKCACDGSSRDPIVRGGRQMRFRTSAVRIDCGFCNNRDQKDEGDIVRTLAVRAVIKRILFPLAARIVRKPFEQPTGIGRNRPLIYGCPHRN